MLGFCCGKKKKKGSRWLISLQSLSGRYESEVESAADCTVVAVKSFGAWQCLKEPGSFRADRVVSQSGQKPATKRVNFFLSSLNEMPSQEWSLGSHVGTCAVTEMVWGWQTLISSFTALVWSSRKQEMLLHPLTQWGGGLWWTPCKSVTRVPDEAAGGSFPYLQLFPFTDDFPNASMDQTQVSLLQNGEHCPSN